MPEMSLSEAAKWAGVSRPTMSKAIKAGRLSSSRTEGGEHRIDPAEVERVYGEHRRQKQEKQHVEGVAIVNSETQALIASKDDKIALLEQVVSEVRQQRDDATKQRDEAQRREEETRALLRDLPKMLTHHQPSSDAISKAAAPAKRDGWFGRLRGFGFLTQGEAK